MEQFEQKLWLQWLEEGRPVAGADADRFVRTLFDLNQVRGQGAGPDVS